MKKNRTFLNYILMISVLCTVSGCRVKKKDQPIQGTVYVLHDLTQKPKESPATSPFLLGKPSSPIWTHPYGGTPQHHVGMRDDWGQPQIVVRKLGAQKTQKVQSSIGGMSISDGFKHYLWNGHDSVSAFSLEGKLLWTYAVVAGDLSKKKNVWGKKKTPVSQQERGGIACFSPAKHKTRLYVATGLGELLCLNHEGVCLWNTKLDLPVRGAPLVTSRHVFVQTVDDRTLAFNLEGELLWAHQAQISATLSLQAPFSPAFCDEEGLVIVGYASGEICALDQHTGRIVWTTQVTPPAIATQGLLDVLQHFVEAPVLKDGKIYITVYRHRRLCLDLMTGHLIWEAPGGGMGLPLLSGNRLFGWEEDGALVCRDAQTGGLCWKQPKEVFQGNEKKSSEDRKRIGFHITLSPWLNRSGLWILSQQHLYHLDPKTGQIQSAIPIAYPQDRRPCMVNNHLLF